MNNLMNLLHSIYVTREKMEEREQVRERKRIQALGQGIGRESYRRESEKQRGTAENKMVGHIKGH